jgi:hypothetical protein
VNVAKKPVATFILKIVKVIGDHFPLSR